MYQNWRVWFENNHLALVATPREFFCRDSLMWTDKSRSNVNNKSSWQQVTKFEKGGQAQNLVNFDGTHN
jgi:hypothetical protein